MIDRAIKKASLIFMMGVFIPLLVQLIQGFKCVGLGKTPQEALHRSHRWLKQAYAKVTNSVLAVCYLTVITTALLWIPIRPALPSSRFLLGSTWISTLPLFWVITLPLALVAIVITLVTWHIFAIVPVLLHKIDTLATGTILMAVPAPSSRVFTRNMQVYGCAFLSWALNYDGITIDHLWRRNFGHPSPIKRQKLRDKFNASGGFGRPVPVSSATSKGIANIATIDSTAHSGNIFLSPNLIVLLR